jgi:hypothetical protein
VQSLPVASAKSFRNRCSSLLWLRKRFKHFAIAAESLKSLSNPFAIASQTVPNRYDVAQKFPKRCCRFQRFGSDRDAGEVVCECCIATVAIIRNHSVVVAKSLAFAIAVKSLRNRFNPL